MLIKHLYYTNSIQQTCSIGVSWTRSQYINWAIGWTAKKSGFGSQQGQEIFPLAASRLALEHTQLPTYGYQGLFPLGIKKGMKLTTHLHPKLAASRLALECTQLPTCGYQGLFPLGIKQGHEADHSPPSKAKFNNTWSLASIPQFIIMAWWLIKHKDSFTVYIPLFWISTMLLFARHSHYSHTPK